MPARSIDEEVQHAVMVRIIRRIHKRLFNEPAHDVWMNGREVDQRAAGTVVRNEPCVLEPLAARLDYLTDPRHDMRRSIGSQQHFLDVRETLAEKYTPVEVDARERDAALVEPRHPTHLCSVTCYGCGGGWAGAA